MFERVSAIVLGALLVGAAPAQAQSPPVAATAAAPSAAAALPVPGAAAVTAFMSGQATPGAQQVVPLPNGNGYTLLVVEPPGGQDHPSHVTRLPARSYFESENYTAFAPPPFAPD